MASKDICLRTSDTLQICTACGTQFAISSGKTSCRICDDPRQFVPPVGQTFTTLAKMREDGFKNQWQRDDFNGREVFSVWTEPKFAIGQRAILIPTPEGNILWDCITLLDQETVDKISSLGGLIAIVISHPHYYTTHLDWSATFSCPVYISSFDSMWLEPSQSSDSRILFPEITKSITSAVTALRCGGHFPGSLCLHYNNMLFIADTLVTVPSGRNPSPPLPSSTSLNGIGTVTYAFMYSIPNMIPLSPSAINGIWKALRDPKITFDITLGAFVGLDVREDGGEGRRSLKGRVLDSMQIAVEAMGYLEVEGEGRGLEILSERV